jgi:flagellar assembly protein FliH
MFTRNFSREDEEMRRRAAAGEDRVYSVSEHTQLLEAAVAAAGEDAYQRGLEAGRAEALSSIDGDVSRILASVEADVVAMIQREAVYREELERQIYTMASTLVAKIAPYVVSSLAKGAIDGAIREGMAMAMSDPSIIIEVSEAAAVPLRARLSVIVKATGYDGTFTIKGSPEMASAQVKVSWSNGFFEHNLNDVMAHVLSALPDVSETPITDK